MAKIIPFHPLQNQTPPNYLAVPTSIVFERFMALLQRFVLTIKIYTILRLQFIFLLVKTYTREKYFQVMQMLAERKTIRGYRFTVSKRAHYISMEMDTKEIAGIQCVAGKIGNTKHFVPNTSSGGKVISFNG